MKEEQETKKEWAAPEIVHLDVDKTAGGGSNTSPETAFMGFMGYS